jgi:hypothetical protein
MRQRDRRKETGGRSRPRIAAGRRSVTPNSANPPLLVYWAFTVPPPDGKGAVMPVPSRRR